MIYYHYSTVEVLPDNFIYKLVIQNGAHSEQKPKQANKNDLYFIQSVHLKT